jgi:hypothetical protein
VAAERGARDAPDTGESSHDTLEKNIVSHRNSK